MGLKKNCDFYVLGFMIYAYVLGWAELEEEQTEHAYVNVLTRGDLSSLRWITSPLRYFVPSNPNVQLCQVDYASLNFRDIMLATGKLPPDAIPGRNLLQVFSSHLELVIGHQLFFMNFSLSFFCNQKIDPYYVHKSSCQILNYTFFYLQVTWHFSSACWEWNFLGGTLVVVMWWAFCPLKVWPHVLMQTDVSYGMCHLTGKGA